MDRTFSFLGLLFALAVTLVNGKVTDEYLIGTRINLTYVPAHINSTTVNLTLWYSMKPNTPPTEAWDLGVFDNSGTIDFTPDLKNTIAQLQIPFVTTGHFTISAPENPSIVFGTIDIYQPLRFENITRYTAASGKTYAAVVQIQPELAIQIVDIVWEAAIVTINGQTWNEIANASASGYEITTSAPTSAPTFGPTMSPIYPTMLPTKATPRPTRSPTNETTTKPTRVAPPTLAPTTTAPTTTKNPTPSPTRERPTTPPTAPTTSAPTVTPPTVTPTTSPTTTAPTTAVPTTVAPTVATTAAPTTKAPTTAAPTTAAPTTAAPTVATTVAPTTAAPTTAAPTTAAPTTAAPTTAAPTTTAPTTAAPTTSAPTTAAPTTETPTTKAPTTEAPTTAAPTTAAPTTETPTTKAPTTVAPTTAAPTTAAPTTAVPTTAVPTTPPTQTPTTAAPTRLFASKKMELIPQVWEMESNFSSLYRVQVDMPPLLGPYDLSVGFTAILEGGGMNATNITVTFYTILGAPNFNTPLLLYDSSSLSLSFKKEEFMTYEPVGMKAKIGNQSIPLAVGLQLIDKPEIAILGCNPPYQASDYTTFGWFSKQAPNGIFPEGNYITSLYWYPNSNVEINKLDRYALMSDEEYPMLEILGDVNTTVDSFIVNNIVTLTIGKDAVLNITTAFSKNTPLQYRILQLTNNVVTFNGSLVNFTYSGQAYDSLTVPVPNEGLSTSRNTSTFIQFMAQDCSGVFSIENKVPFSIGTAESSSSSSSLNAGEITGIVIGGVVLILIIAYVTWRYIKHKRSSREPVGYAEIAETE